MSKRALDTISLMLALFGIYLIIDSIWWMGYIQGKRDKENFLDSLRKRTSFKDNILKYPPRTQQKDKTDDCPAD